MTADTAIGIQIGDFRLQIGGSSGTENRSSCIVLRPSLVRRLTAHGRRLAAHDIADSRLMIVDWRDERGWLTGYGLGLDEDRTSFIVGAEADGLRLTADRRPPTADSRRLPQSSAVS